MVSQYGFKARVRQKFLWVGPYCMRDKNEGKSTGGIGRHLRDHGFCCVIQSTADAGKTSHELSWKVKVKVP